MIEIINDPTICPHCGKNAKGHSSIETEFGFRNMGDTTIRVQSWCRECRKESCKGAVA